MELFEWTRTHARKSQAAIWSDWHNGVLVGSPTVDLIQGAFLVLHVERIEEFYVMY